MKDGARYIWDDYNIIAENAGVANETYNTWGLDLDGTMQGLGGVGGLLATEKANTLSLPSYDGNGNITEYISDDGAIVSHSDYSSFGRERLTCGDNNYSHRFSTKPTCRRSGLVEYQMRDYMPWLGRWQSRDLMGEIGGLNQFGFVGNMPLMNIEVHGSFGVPFKSLFQVGKKVVGNILRNRDPDFWDNWKSFLENGLDQREEDPRMTSAREAYAQCNDARISGECPKCCVVLAKPSIDGGIEILSATPTQSSCAVAAETGWLHAKGTFIQLLPMY